MSAKINLTPFLWPLLLLVAGGCSTGDSPAELSCHAGAYRLGSGELVVITPSGGETLRYRLQDGRSGRLHPREHGGFESGPDWSARTPVVATAEFGECADGTLVFAHAHGPSGRATRVEFRVRESSFASDGIELYGRLVLPREPTDTIAIMVHGSERDSALVYDYLQFLLPAHGIGAFVFDKRGTGRSEGRYTQDFPTLAADVSAAVAHVRAIAPESVQRVGLVGGSQGGWVAPLAASRTPVDFVVVAFGMAEGPLAEDREEVLSELRRKGYGEDVLAKAREVTQATGQVIASGYRSGWKELERVRAAYGDEPWFGEIRGEYTGDILSHPAWLVRVIGPFYDQGTSWDHDPQPILAAPRTPMLWILAGSDTEGPSETTLSILRALQPQPAQLDVAVFPTAEHGIIEFEERDGERVLLRHSPGYFALLVHWIRRHDLAGEFGNAVLYPDRGPPPKNRSDPTRK